MPIRFVDKTGQLGRVSTTLAAAVSAIVGTHTQPASRTGTISAQLGSHSASLIGQFQANAARTGTIDTTLSNAISTIIGSVPASASLGIRFTPGHYKWIDTGSGGGGLAGWVNQVTAISGEPTLAGVQFSPDWSDVETNVRGVYDWTILDQIVNAATAINKKVMLYVKFQYFGTSPTSPNGRFPTYLATIQSGSPGYTVWNGTNPASPPGNLILVANLWDSRVMTPYIELGQAIANRYKNNPTVEMYGIGETSIANLPGSGYATSAWITQLKLWMSAQRAAWPNTAVRVQTNYLDTDAQMQDLIAYAYQYQIACGGPDNYSRTYQSNPIFTGYIGGIDYRNRIPWVSESQYPASSSGGPSATSSQIYNHNVSGALVDGGSTQPQYFIWLNNTFTNSGQYHTFPAETLPFIRSINGACNTTNPYMESLPLNYTLLGSLTWISWDAPTIAYPGIDVNHVMVGYDWFRRPLTWSIDSGPAWLSIGATSGILTGSPPTDNTNHSVTVRMTPLNGAGVTKTFVMQVASGKCKFVSLSGSDSTGSGALDAPYRTIGKAMDVTAVTHSGWLILIRNGTYSTETWANGVNWWGQNFTPANPWIIRNYPGETVVINNPANGAWGTFTDYVIYQGLDVRGGGARESSVLSVNDRNIAKLCSTSGYRCLDGAIYNPTGCRTRGGAILYKHTSFDNRSADSDFFSGSTSNYLHYCDDGTNDQAFLIDCIGAGQTVVNFKVKHSGRDRVHYHGCVAYGAPNGFDALSNWSSVRHCLGVGQQGFAVGNRATLNFGGSSPGPGSSPSGDTDLGMLFDGNLMIAESGENALDLNYDSGGSDLASNCFVVRSTTLVTVTTTSTANNGMNWPIRRQSYNAPQPSPKPRKVIDCVLYSPTSANSQVNYTTSAVTLSIAQVNTQPGCSGNAHAGALASTLTFKAAGYNWSYTIAGGLVQGSAL